MILSCACTWARSLSMSILRSLWLQPLPIQQKFYNINHWSRLSISLSFDYYVLFCLFLRSHFAFCISSWNKECVKWSVRSDNFRFFCFVPKRLSKDGMVALKGPQNVLKKESLQNYFPPPPFWIFCNIRIQKWHLRFDISSTTKQTADNLIKHSTSTIEI